MQHTTLKTAVFAGTALAITLSLAAPVLAATGEVIIRTPDAADVHPPLSLTETSETIAAGLLAYVDRIDVVTRNYSGCLETAARLAGADATNEKRACAVTLQGAKIELIGDLQDTMSSTGREFYALGERIGQIIRDIGRDKQSAEAEVQQIAAEVAMLIEGSRGFFNGLDPNSLTREQRSQMNAVLRERDLSLIAKRRAERRLAALDRKYIWLTQNEDRIEEWAFTLVETGLQFEVEIALAEERIEEILLVSDWEALVGDSTGVPAVLNGINGVFGDIAAFNEMTAEIEDLGANEASGANADLPGPDVSGDAQLYDQFAELFSDSADLGQ